MLLAVFPQVVRLVFELRAIFVELLLALLRHLRPLLGRGQLHAKVGDFLLCLLLTFEHLLHLRPQLFHPCGMLLSTFLLLQAAQLLDMAFDRVLQAIEVLQGEPTHLLKLIAHDFRHALLHLVDIAQLLVAHLLQLLIRGLLSQQSLTHLVPLFFQPQEVPRLLNLAVLQLLLHDAEDLGIPLPQLLQRARNLVGGRPDCPAYAAACHHARPRSASSALGDLLRGPRARTPCAEPTKDRRL
mmetsp:Transcript_36112/g.91933  ORF Transcript_36112/g.91933 Transcript_36112/m.91933 type:complete len:241 (+) Transcript_36112:717-1439(+)